MMGIGKTLGGLVGAGIMLKLSHDLLIKPNKELFKKFGTKKKYGRRKQK